MKKCFIVCPIGKDGTETRKRSDQLLKHIITPVCEECGFEPIRVDNLNNSDSITQTIIEYITNSDLVIADLTEHNPNAFFEIGYRFALKKPIIHLKSKDDSIPFDVSSMRTFDYDLTDLDSVEELKRRLEQTIKSIDFKTTEKDKPKLLAENFNAQVLQELFKIQDEIKKLSLNISTKDNSAVSVLADKLVNSNTNSTESKLMELLIPTMLENPEKLNALIEFGNKVNNV